ncbi:uncharacterized protein LOC111121330 [Crassostrea virginica]
MDIEKLSLRRFMEKTNLKQRLKYLLGQTRVMNDVWVHFKRLHGVPPGGRGRRNHPPCVRKRATTLNKMKVCYDILQRSILCLTLCPGLALMRVLDEPPFYLDARECRDMFPESLRENATNAGTSESEDPFDIELSPMIYKKNSVITVKIFSKKAFESDYPIRGALLQARVADCQSEDQGKAIGMFQEVPHKPFRFHTTSCPNSLTNGVAAGALYKDKDGMPEVSIDWMPPEQENRTLYFVATVLSTNNTFFTNIASGFLVHYSNKKDQSKAEICPLREFLKESRSSGTGIHVLPVWHLLLLLLLGLSEH